MFIISKMILTVIQVYIRSCSSK